MTFRLVDNNNWRVCQHSPENQGALRGSLEKERNAQGGTTVTDDYPEQRGESSLNGDKGQIESRSKARILIVDGHPIVREGMAHFLNLQDNLHLCCQASNTKEALDAATTCNHDLAIVEIYLGEDSGLRLIKILRQHNPKLAILLMSMHDEPLFAERALRSGANGYLTKKEGTQNILLAIQQILVGNISLSASLRSRVAQHLLSQSRIDLFPLAVLTKRELEILQLIGQGFSPRQIAEKLSRSIKTIDVHHSNLKEKLHQKSGRDLFQFAVQILEASCSKCTFN